MNESISPETKAHYILEKKLADKIRNTPWPERGKMYIDAYNEIYQKLPDHPLKQIDILGQKESIRQQLGMIKKFLSTEKTFLEIGPGNCSLLFNVSKLVKEAFGVDVSTEIIKELSFPLNAHLLLSDGRNIPLPDDSVDVAFSHQFIEHLHQEDAIVHLENVYKVLKINGVYICITPNKITGPHDISRHYDRIATCFHLREYTIFELSQIMKQVGFSKIRYVFGCKGIFYKIPLFPAIICEKFINYLPYKVQQLLAKKLPFRLLLDVRIIGYK